MIAMQEQTYQDLPTMTTDAVRQDLGYADRKEVHRLVDRGELTAYIVDDELSTWRAKRIDEHPGRHKAYMFKKSEVEAWKRNHPNREIPRIEYTEDMKRQVLAIADEIKADDGSVKRGRVVELMHERYHTSKTSHLMYRRIKTILADAKIPYMRGAKDTSQRRRM